MSLPAVRPIRVLVVEDSARLRARIVETLSADPVLEVVGQAADGRTAIDRCLELRPDIVTMDVILPVINGLAVTEQLMQRCPTPILIISAATDPGELVNTFAALAAGAVDVLEKPRANTVDDRDWNRRLLSTVKLVARIQVITHLGKGPVHSGASPSAATEHPTPHRPPTAVRPPASATAVHPVTPRPPAPRPAAGPARLSAPGAESGYPDPGFSVLALGASTGGPAAVATVLGALPSSFRPPVLLVLHVSEHFGPAIANWLKDVTRRPVRLAEHGEPLSALTGQVVMAPPGQHLTVQKKALVLTQDPERHSCRPSVDVLFESVADQFGSRVAACLLTGMGKDGASGLLDVHRRGGLTIAQDEASSVVFGMPGEAVRLGAAQHVLGVDQIGPMLGRLVAGEVSR
jgi:two-component system, chemotaxis family, protein-glutamate methylesterase/glutaminase